ncbi:MAG: zf-HC2 domain-containing protein [Chitinivibrionia bacterium]|nr:zf-HC2 domain-containing protein [Chitinivibrionia bacterium]
MVCTRFQSDGMKLLDGEMTGEEKTLYEDHIRECEDCRRELEDLGLLVEWTNQLRLKLPDDSFWEAYWDGFYRKAERGTGFILLMAGIAGLCLFAIAKAVTSPGFLTFTGITITVALAGLLVVFISVARERYHERKYDPYRKVKR